MVRSVSLHPIRGADQHSGIDVRDRYSRALSSVNRAGGHCDFVAIVRALGVSRIRKSAREAEENGPRCSLQRIRGGPNSGELGPRSSGRKRATRAYLPRLGAALVHDPQLSRPIGLPAVGASAHRNLRPAVEIRQHKSPLLPSRRPVRNQRSLLSLHRSRPRAVTVAVIG
jgi:hypothetical protein